MDFKLVLNIKMALVIKQCSILETIDFNSVQLWVFIKHFWWFVQRFFFQSCDEKPFLCQYFVNAIFCKTKWLRLAFLNFQSSRCPTGMENPRNLCALKCVLCACYSVLFFPEGEYAQTKSAWRSETRYKVATNCVFYA